MAVIPRWQRCWSNIDSLKYLCPQGDADLISHWWSRCQAQPPYGREINCQHVLNKSHNLLLAKGGICHGSHTQCHSQALLSLPSGSFVTYPAQIFSTWGLALPCPSNSGFVLLPLISIAIHCPLTEEIQTSWQESNVREGGGTQMFWTCKEKGFFFF